MNRKLILTLIILTLCGNVFSQDVKFRIGGNYSKFNKETGQKEVIHPLVEQLSNPNSTEFTNNFEANFETEVMLLWTPNIETGLELDFSKFSGYNDVPPYYNYYFAPDNPTEITTTEPLIYDSKAVSLLANFRFYFAPDGKVNPFFKAFGGISFVGAEFNYKDQSVWQEGEAGVLYAIGTKNSDSPKEAAFTYGAGAGFDFEISDKISIYIDGTATVINSDKVDGIPNYNYIADSQKLEPAGNKSFITQISLGLVFKTGTNLGLNKNWGKDKRGGKIKRSGRTLPWRPFYRQK